MNRTLPFPDPISTNVNFAASIPIEAIVVELVLSGEVENTFLEE